jgi:hypothetical protein
MAMATHNIFPPPQTVGGEFGEERRVQFTQLGECERKTRGAIESESAVRPCLLVAGLKGKGVGQVDGVGCWGEGQI